MSANIVEEDVTRIIVRYALKRSNFRYSFEGKCYNENQLGQILTDENYRSVNIRYNENDKPTTYKSRVFPYGSYLFEKDNYGEHQVEAVSLECPKLVLNLISYWSYQSCESDNYDETLAYRIIKDIERLCIYQLTEGMPLGFSIDENYQKELRIKKDKDFMLKRR